MIYIYSLTYIYLFQKKRFSKKFVYDIYTCHRRSGLTPLITCIRVTDNQGVNKTKDLSNLFTLRNGNNCYERLISIAESNGMKHSVSQ